MVGVAQFLGQDPAGDRDGHVGRLLPDLGQGLVASLARCRAGARCLASSASAWACLIDWSAVACASCLRLVEDAPHLVGRLGHQLAVLGQIGLALVACTLGLEQDVLEVLLAVVQRRQERLPGELRRTRSNRTKTTSVQMARPGSGFTGLIGASGGTPSASAILASSPLGCGPCRWNSCARSRLVGPSVVSTRATSKQ